jgi:phosphate transport system protein
LYLIDYSPCDRNRPAPGVKDKGCAMHTREKFERDLQQLSDDILLMASRVEEQLSLALASYERLDPSLTSLVNDIDRQVNKTRFDIEERCLELIAMQQPAARDLRLIIAVLNMIVDIERMGDQAKGVMKALQHMHLRPEVDRPEEIEQMGKLVLDMLRRAKEAYVQRDIKLAQAVGRSDDEVDKLYAKAFTQIMYHMAGSGSPEQIESQYELLRIAREFERFGDLVTNIAERLIFLVTGSMTEINSDDPTPE